MSHKGRTTGQARASDDAPVLFVSDHDSEELYVLPPDPSDAGGSPLVLAPGIDPGQASVARIYDYLLGGTNNLPVDQKVAEHLTELVPEVKAGAWANRGFHQRAARWLAEQGIEQFIDIGSGLPTQRNTHEIVHAINPSAHVVYVDNDTAAAELATRLLADLATATFIDRDLREPDRILSHPNLHKLIDLTKPVALLTTAVLHFVADDADPWGLIAYYLGACAPGSFLALSHATSDHYKPELIDRIQGLYANTNEPFYPRPKQQVESFFTGLDIVPPYPGARPSITYGGLWGAEDPAEADDDSTRWFYAGVARKP